MRAMTAARATSSLSAAGHGQIVEAVVEQSLDHAQNAAAEEGPDLDACLLQQRLTVTGNGAAEQQIEAVLGQRPGAFGRVIPVQGQAFQLLDAAVLQPEELDVRRGVEQGGKPVLVTNESYDHGCFIGGPSEVSRDDAG